MKRFPLPTERAHHPMVEVIRDNMLPASRLPKVIEAREEPRYGEFKARTAWSLFNAFTEVEKSASPRFQIERALRHSSRLRKELALN